MKKLKKIFAVLMTAAMVMGLGMTTMAAGEATITVNGLDEKANITYLQVVKENPKSTQGWSFVTEEIATVFKTVFNAATNEEALEDLLTLGGGNVNASAGTISTSEELGKALSNLQDSASETEGVTGNVITVKDAGLYLIVANSSDSTYQYIPMLAYVNRTPSGTLENATVSAKGSHTPIDKKLVNEDDQSVSEGDEIEYEATVQYPFYSADEENPTFSVTDTLTNATFKENSLKVTIGDTLAVVGVDYTVNTYADTSTMEISFIYKSEYAKETVKIEYTAIAGGGTDNVVNQIKTNLDTNGDSVTSSKVSVKVLKTGEKDVALPGATFEIYEVSEVEKDGFEEKANISVVTPGVSADVETKTVYLKKVADGVTAGQDGSITFSGLDAQKTYYIKETQAPSGYTVNPNYFNIGTASLDASESDEDTFIYNDFANITVDNDTLGQLPSTGGIGTTIFTIGGIIIMVAAAALFFANRRKNESK